MTTQRIVFTFLVLILSACSLVPGATSIQAEPLILSPNPPVSPAVVLPAAGTPVLLFGIGMHIEPLGTTHQGYKSSQGNYQDLDFFNRHVKDILTVTGMVSAHGGHMTIQAQSPFTEIAAANHNPILSNLAASGHEIALHFHEDAHLGKTSTTLAVEDWCRVMKEEISLIKQASGVTDIRYWSGGNLYPNLLQAVSCAGLTINSDWKNPQTQSTDASLVGIHPWKPAGGTDGTSFSRFSAHDPAGKVIFLPEGLYDRGNFASMRRSEAAGGDEAYFKYLEQSLLNSLAATEAGQANVFHFTIHPGEFRGDPQHPFDVIEKFLSEVVDPLVAAGKVQWATFGQMADAYAAWENAHANQDMR